MSTALAEFTIPKITLPETDGEPLDSPWHRDEIHLLIESVHCHFVDRTDFYVGGNMFIYYSLEQVRNREYRGPDFFFVNGVDRTRSRLYWAVWEENGKYPDVIIELLSHSTATEDRTTKKAIYEKTFRTPEYFLYDPETRSLEGWRLAGRTYQRIQPDERGWLWSEELGLWLGTWEGEYLGEDATWLRFYDSEGRLVLLAAEGERGRAETERQRAMVERQRADAERQRAEAAEAEVARLKAQLSAKTT